MFSLACHARYFAIISKSLFTRTAQCTCKNDVSAAYNPLVSAWGKRAVFPATALTVLLLLGGCGGGDSNNDVPNRSEKIVFVSRDEGFDGINAINPDGTGRRLLFPADGYMTGATFSPDGSKIAFLSSRNDCGGVGCSTVDGSYTGPLQIWLMNADGSGLRQITSRRRTSAGEPIFSSDGSRIFYSSYEDTVNGSNQYAVHAVNLDGGSDTELFRGQDMYQVALSPDGSKVVFSSDRDGDDAVFNSDILVVNVDGSGETRLTDSPLYDSGASFSPDGSKILFCRGGEIYVMNADGTNQTPITSNNASAYAPSYSPDGTKILFTSNREISGSVADASPSRIFVMNADGTDQRATPARETVNGFTPFFDSASHQNAWRLTTAR